MVHFKSSLTTLPESLSLVGLVMKVSLLSLKALSLVVLGKKALLLRVIALSLVFFVMNASLT